ncbi:unnamed protein product [Pieris macdunnoughi]|uniref:Uncharacterized protein n=1 Tax=Pieris macdunnoughi TaxID=345717 RepID=A0A821UKE6_9NEOP|nr:unnamed protein product [Pieris macdunnoughi]
MDSRARRIMKLLNSPSHHRLECGSENDRSISPLHSGESDVDLSDDDPTYNQDQNLRQRSPSPAVISSNKPRKRKADKNKWMQNAQKIKRNLGQSYVAVHSKKLAPARSIKPPCGQNCTLKCADRINDARSLDIFNTFWALGDRQLQMMYILSNCTKITPKYKYTNAENPRNPNHAFYFSVDDEKIRVCKTLFINTLDISHKIIRTVQIESRNTGGFIKDDKRGKHKNYKTAVISLLRTSSTLSTPYLALNRTS